MKLFRALTFSIAIAVTATVFADDAKWINLIKEINPQEHTAAGRWQRKGDELTVTAETGARIMIPVQPAGEYDSASSLRGTRACIRSR